MITGKDIKDLRMKYGVTQEGLARAIFVENASTISNYESGTRKMNIETIEAIANVFGYTVVMQLAKKENSTRDENFFKDKSYNEIMNMSNEDLTDYIFITQSENMIARICGISEVVASSLELTTLNDLIKNTVLNSRRDVLYFKLNKMHYGFELDMAILIEDLKEYIAKEDGIPNDIKDKVHYIYYGLYGDIYRGEIESESSMLLDENKNDLGVDEEFIFQSEYNPVLYNCQDTDFLVYLKENDFIKIKY